MLEFIYFLPQWRKSSQNSQKSCVTLHGQIKIWFVISSCRKVKNQKPISRKIFVPSEHFLSSFTQIHYIPFFLWPSVQARNTDSRAGSNIYWCTSQFFPRGVILQTFAYNAFKESFSCHSTSIDFIRFESAIWWAMLHILIFLFIITHRQIKVKILQYSPRKGKNISFKTFSLAWYMEILFENIRTSKRVHWANFIRVLNYVTDKRMFGFFTFFLLYGMKEIRSNVLRT